MSPKYFILLLVIGILFPSSGGYAGSSYQYGSNARSIALSNSLISSYNKGYNPLTNPALLGRKSAELEYGFSYFDMSLDRSIQTLSATIPFPPSASMGLSLFMTSVDDIQGTNTSGNYTNLYKAWEGFGMLSFGIELNRLSAGVNLKILKSEIDTYSASGIGIDIGFLCRISSKHQFAFLVNNLHSKYTWDTVNLYEEKFPKILSLGGSSEMSKSILYLYRIDYSLDSNILLYKFGIEIDILSARNIQIENDAPAFFRLGLNSKHGSFSPHPSFGFGYNIPMKNKLNLGIDYAIDLGMVDEGISHLFTLTFSKK